MDRIHCRTRCTDAYLTLTVLSMRPQTRPQTRPLGVSHLYLKSLGIRLNMFMCQSLSMHWVIVDKHMRLGLSIYPNNQRFSLRCDSYACCYIFFFILQSELIQKQSQYEFGDQIKIDVVHCERRFYWIYHALFFNETDFLMLIRLFSLICIVGEHKARVNDYVYVSKNFQWNPWNNGTR